uniref:Thioredoxin domain-containing protein n=1 Tax=Rhizochromulina marina TaxID=1034831 RepID=A0A7S2RB92_9STRA
MQYFPPALVCPEMLWEWIQEHRWLAIVCLILLWNYYQKSKPMPPTGGRVIAVHSEGEWKEALQLTDLVLVDFFATWCPPCRSAAPYVGKLSEKYGAVTFVKVDVDEIRQLSVENGVSSLPTFQLFRNGQKIDETVGFRPAAIEHLLTKAGATVQPAPGDATTEENGSKAE